VCVCVCVSLCVLLLFFSDCRIYLFSSLAARVFNKLTCYLLTCYVCACPVSERLAKQKFSTYWLSS